ncbi:MAG: hypothetical protein ABIU95_05565 [Burkholderiales bacterium]
MRMGVLRRTFLVVACAVIASCSGPFDWREFTWPEGELRVLLPDKPHRESGSVTIGGTPLTLTLFPVRVDGLSFAVGYAPLPAGLDAAGRAKLALAARNSFIGNLGAATPTTKAIAVGPSPGWSFAATATRDGKALAMAGRVVTTETRYYQAIFVGPASRAGDAEVTLFLDSLVVGPDANRGSK